MNPGILGLPGDPQFGFNDPSTWGGLGVNMVGYWPLTEPQGARADKTGLSGSVYPRSATYQSVGTALGPRGRRPQFTNNTDALYGEYNANQVFGTGPFEVAFWVNFITLNASGSTDGLFTHGRPSASIRCWGVQLQSSNQFFQFEAGSIASSGATITDAVASHYGKPPTGTDIFVNAWYDGSNLNIQINQGTVNSTTYSGGSYTGGNLATCIGGYDDGVTYCMKGYMDNVGLWARNLTSAERTFLYNGGVGQVFPTS